MDANFVSILSIGLLLGIKHAIEPDHIIAVSTIASHSKKLWRSSLAGVFWGIGHTATLIAAGAIMLLMKREIPAAWASSLEFLVGIMLVYLGLSSIHSLRKQRVHVHEHVHVHDGDSHKHFHSHQRTKGHYHLHKEIPYLKSALIGMIHGLAGSAAMVLLTMATVKNAFEGTLYIFIFGAGTTLGMLLFTTLIGIPFVFSSKQIHINKTLTRLAGFASTAYGFYYMYEKGITEGLFSLWLK